MEKAIVTGSEGFIGNVLVQALQKRGVEVIGIDRRSGREAADIAEYMPDDIDTVFHLASQTSVFNDNLDQIRADNIDTFMAVVQACARHPRQPKLVYASSSTANAPNTTSLYGISKHFAEDYAKTYLPSATGVRLHNVYGPNPRQGTLLWYLLNRETVTLYNGGQNVRHFTYIGDAIEGLLYAAKSKKPLLNVANPESVTTLRFASVVKELRPELNLIVSEAKRELDHTAQALNPYVPVVPAKYRPIEEGIRLSMPK